MPITIFKYHFSFEICALRHLFCFKSRRAGVCVFMSPDIGPGPRCEQHIRARQSQKYNQFVFIRCSIPPQIYPSHPSPKELSFILQTYRLCLLSFAPHLHRLNLASIKKGNKRNTGIYVKSLTSVFPLLTKHKRKCLETLTNTKLSVLSFLNH